MLHSPFSHRARRGALTLGLGLGGFLDGIVLHQILGWHHVVCRTETCTVDSADALRIQNTQDGFFHLATWCLTVAGVAMLVRAMQREPAPTGRFIAGYTLAGWGWFNLIEGLIDHQLLGLHHVRPASSYWPWYDAAFLLLGVALIFGGRRWARGGTVHRVL